MQHLSSFIAIWESLIVIYQRLLEGPLCAENVGLSLAFILMREFGMPDYVEL